jgi:hypothetical protein
MARIGVSAHEGRAPPPSPKKNEAYERISTVCVITPLSSVNIYNNSQNVL